MERAARDAEFAACAAERLSVFQTLTDVVRFGLVEHGAAIYRSCVAFARLNTSRALSTLALLLSLALRFVIQREAHFVLCRGFCSYPAILALGQILTTFVKLLSKHIMQKMHNSVLLRKET
jgi:hypothetical protein